MRANPDPSVPRQPKTMFGFAGRSMIGHVLAACAPLDSQQSVVVVGHLGEQLIEHLKLIAPTVETVVQDQQLGTGHAVAVALAAVAPQASGTILVALGDTPLLEAGTLAALLHEHDTSGAAITMLTSVLEDPTGLGRVLRSADGNVAAVVEHRDASAAELAITEVASGVYAFDHSFLRTAIGQLVAGQLPGRAVPAGRGEDRRRRTEGRCVPSSPRRINAWASTIGHNWPPPTGCSITG